MYAIINQVFRIDVKIESPSILCDSLSAHGIRISTSYFMTLKRAAHGQKGFCAIVARSHLSLQNSISGLSEKSQEDTRTAKTVSC